MRVTLGRESFDGDSSAFEWKAAMGEPYGRVEMLRDLLARPRPWTVRVVRHTKASSLKKLTSQNVVKGQDTKR